MPRIYLPMCLPLCLPVATIRPSKAQYIWVLNAEGWPSMVAPDTGNRHLAPNPLGTATSKIAQSTRYTTIRAISFCPYHETARGD